MGRKHRVWDNALEDDPGAGLINLIDVWVAFSFALILALISYLYQANILTPSDDADAAAALMEHLKDPKKIPRFRSTDASLSGEGARLGIAYQLRSGEVVYVPDASSSNEK